MKKDRRIFYVGVLFSAITWVPLVALFLFADFILMLKLSGARIYGVSPYVTTTVLVSSSFFYIILKLVVYREQARRASLGKKRS